ncbi:DMT family transporter [Niallia sp. 01092]|uniref:DMT family transporter n=1 Tax=unclassified Niallia TaxID=2837522 RepID=UPI003FD0CC6E
MDKRQIITGTILCFITVLSWGGQFPIMRNALEQIDPFSFTAMRYTLASIIFVLLLVLIEGKQTLNFDGKLKTLWIYGTIGFVGFNFLMFSGQQLAGSSGALLASIILGLMPIISIFVIWIMEKKRPPFFVIGVVLFSLFGTLLVITKGDFKAFSSKGSSLLPIFCMLIGVTCWVVYTMGARKFNDWSPLRYTALSCILGTFSINIIVAFLYIIGSLTVPELSIIKSITLELGYMIVFAGVLAVFCWNAGNKALTPANGVLFINLVPITTIVISVFQGYQITGLELLGTLIIISSLIMNNFYQRKIVQKPFVKLDSHPYKQLK